MRADIIARARVCLSDWLQEIYPMYIGYTSRTDFRYVEVKLFDCAKLKGRGIAKFHPDDVFNEHIGKAIALGRALGKDVSEFENAVQPTKVVVGQVIVWKLHEETVYRIDDKTGNYFNFTDVKTNEKYCDYEYCEIEKHTNVVDDTNAQY